MSPRARSRRCAWRSTTSRARSAGRWPSRPRPPRRRRTNRTGPSRVPVRRAPERARARPGADPPARDRGGHAPVAGPPRGARTADRPRRTRTGSDPVGERIRDRRDGPGGGPQSRRGSPRAEASGPVKDAAVRTRVLVLAAILALAFGGLTGRLAWLMIVKHGELSQLAERQYSRTVVLRAQRGAIVDRRGAALATSTATESLFAHPRSVGDPVRVAARLAPVIGLPELEVRGALTSARPFVWLRRKLPPDVAEQVRMLREPGLGFLPEPLRLYPNRELAAHVVGFEGVEGGLEGIERAFNAELAGVPGKAIVGRDALGREGATQHLLRPPLPGHGVMLTIDSTIQYIAEREIDAAYRRAPPEARERVVLEPRSGDILAMAIRPTFNPNTFLDVPSADHSRKPARTEPFEPGSTFKAILAAAALEESVVRPDDRLNR